MKTNIISVQSLTSIPHQAKNILFDNTSNVSIHQMAVSKEEIGNILIQSPKSYLYDILASNGFAIFASLTAAILAMVFLFYLFGVTRLASETPVT